MSEDNPTANSWFAKRLLNLGFSSYNEYLFSEHWQNFKEAYHKSSLPQDCLVCGTSFRICLHHVTYRRLGYERLTDVVPLCRNHHHAVHEKLKKLKKSVERTAEVVSLLRGVKQPTSKKKRKRKKRKPDLRPLTQEQVFAKAIEATRHALQNDASYKKLLALLDEKAVDVDVREYILRKVNPCKIWTMIAWSNAVRNRTGELRMMMENKWKMPRRA